MKKFLITGLLCIALGITYLYRDDFVRVYNKYFVKTDTIVTLSKKNNYYRNYNFNFVKNTDNFSPNNIQDLYNIYYTTINAGKDVFTFYCPTSSYKNCINDVKYLANDQVTLSNINNFVHPYNGFKHIETTYDTSGRVTIKAFSTYSEKDIEKLNEKIMEIEKKLYNKELSVKEQIKVYHDYIIDNTKYDSNRSDKNVIKYKSDTAYGTLLEGYSLCGGYTDAMAIILTNMGLVNYKISSDNHVWNAVLIDDEWYHLDLTWDDPVTQDGTNLIESDFFLINTSKLFEIEKNEHNFSKEVYSELVESKSST